MRRHTHSRFGAKDGNAIIQFTFALSLLLPLFIGTLEYGYGFYLYSQLSQAVRSGARYASVRTFDSAYPNPPSTAFSTAVQNMVVYGDPTGATTTPLVTGLTTDMVTVGCTFQNRIPATVSVTITGYNLPTYFGTTTLNNNPYEWFPFVGRYGPP